MDTLRRDVTLAWRMLLKRPLISVIAALSLALGIGANTTIFSIVNALFLQSLPVREVGELYTVYTTDAKFQGGVSGALSHLNWKDVREQNEVFEGLLGYDWTQLSVSAGGEPEVVFGQLVSGNYFDVLGVDTALGRTFTVEEDGAPGAHPVAVLSHRFWTQRLAGRPDALGEKLLVNGIPFTVVGVAAQAFTGTDTGVQPELWIPMAMNRQLKPGEFNWYEERRGLFVNSIVRLRPGTSREKAQAGLATIGSRLAAEYPDDNEGRGFTLVPLSQATLGAQGRGPAAMATGMLMTIVGLVLLIACANVANLLLARAAGRRREIAVRLCLGASRAQLVRQLLTESTLLAAIGALAGLLVAYWARGVILTFLPSLPFPVTVSLDLALDHRVLAFTTLLALATGLISGLAPALQSARPELTASLKERGVGEARSGARMSLRSLLVGGQVALSLFAQVGAGLFLRSLSAARDVDSGYDADRLAMTSFDVGLLGYSDERARQFFRDARERALAVPGVEAATLAQNGPFSFGLTRSVFPEGREGEARGTFVQVNVVEPDYFDTVGVRILRGRGFGPGDVAGAPKVVVVNETMAAKYWPVDEALGQRFRFFGDEQLAEVVGVAEDVKYNTLGEDPVAYCYEPLEQRFVTGVTLVVRAVEDPGPLVIPVERELQAMDPDLALMASGTLARRIDGTLWASKLGASLLAIFGGLALLLAAVGIYGVMSYAVSQRSHEIGIRLALGARPGDVLLLILGQGMLVVSIGVAAGLALAVVATRVVAQLLFVSPTDPVVYAGTALVLAATGLLANLLPARRATAVDPQSALRYD
jgi:predicted permease